MSQVVATGSSFGTGIDKGDIRTIFLFSMPKNFEEFYQQIGRAGRDGRPATIHAYIGKGDLFMHLKREKATNKTHLAMQKQEKNSLFALSRMCSDKTTCRRLAIMRYWKEETESNFACGVCDNCRNKIEKSQQRKHTTT